MTEAAADAVAAAILAGVKPEVQAALVRALAKMDGGSAATALPGPENVLVVGRLRYLPGFDDVWVGTEHYNLRERKKARLCLQYLVDRRAFDAASARHLVEEIDLYVRREGDFPRAADVKIGHYFHDPTGRLPKLRQDLIRSAGGNGRYFLNVF